MRLVVPQERGEIRAKQHSLQAALKNRGADMEGIRALINKLTLRDEAAADGSQGS